MQLSKGSDLQESWLKLDQSGEHTHAAIQLKLAMPHVIKKIRHAPENLETLREIIMAQM